MLRSSRRAKELATSGVLVNAIAPAVFATPMNADKDSEVLAHITSLIPMRRFGCRGAGRTGVLPRLRTVSFSTGAVYDVSGGRVTY